jgi:hypothetical protein
MEARRSGLAVVVVITAAFAGGFVAQVLVGSRTALAQEGADRELRVQRLVIVDSRGTERAVLDITGQHEESVGLTMSDPEGRHRVLLGGSGMLAPAAEDYWTLAFIDAAGANRIGWGLRGDGVGCGGHMTGSDGILRLGIGADMEQGTGITLNDATGQQRLGIGLGPGGGGDFVAKDRFGNDVWRALGEIPRPALP